MINQIVNVVDRWQATVLLPLAWLNHERAVFVHSSNMFNLLEIVRSISPRKSKLIYLLTRRAASALDMSMPSFLK